MAVGAVRQVMRAALSGSLRRLPRPVYGMLRGTIPSPIRRSLVRAVGPAPDAVAAATPNPYVGAWETLARVIPDDAIGGDFDLGGRIQLGVLLMEGLRPTDTLLDFGCGSGRLALKAIPMLQGGQYFGVDVSQTMVELARDRVATQYPNPSCRVSWLQLGEPPFPLEERSIDVACAFSDFTHIEHEDAYRYLKDALRIVGPGGRFIFSCLPMTLAYARPFFLAAAAQDFRDRWSSTRNITTSVDFMEALATLAGWTPVRWYAGDQYKVRLPESDEFACLGQSICVLAAPQRS
jgi:ubiquinone/menaquinone biosynthesis C-methylase UbiE